MPELIASIVYHLVLGLALSAVVWGVGLGWLVIAARRTGEIAAADAVYSYPLGLVAAFLFAFAYLVHPLAGALVGGAVIAGAAFGLRRGREYIERVWRVVARPLAAALPFALAFCVAFGIKWRGPTDELATRSGADYLYHVARAFAATVSVLPYRDLMIEGKSQGLLETGPALLAATLWHLPAIDPFTVYSATLPAVLLVSLAIGLGLVRAGGTAISALGERALPLSLCALALLAYASLDTITQLAGSPPTSLVVPLGFAVYRLHRHPPSPALFVMVTTAVAVALLFTKVWAFALLGLIVLATALRADYRRRLGTRWLAALAGSGVVVAGLGLAYFFAFGKSHHYIAWTPQFFPKHGLERLQDFRVETELRAGYAPIAFPGQILFAIVLLRARAFAIAGAFTLTMLYGWIVQADFARLEIASGLAILLGALFFIERPDELRRQRWLVAVAALSIGFAAWLKDYDELRTVLVFLLLFVATFVAAVIAVGLEWFGRGVYLAMYPVVAAGVTIALASKVYVAVLYATGFGVAFAFAARPSAPRGTRWVVAVALSGVLAAAAISFRSWQYGNYRFGTFFPLLLPADHDIWRAVDRDVPEGAIVFTDAYGDWPAYYPSAGRRQLYLGGIKYTTLSRAEQERRARMNALVAAGCASPSEAKLARSYPSYFAVLRSHEHKLVPRTFSLVYRNEALALYRIRVRAGGGSTPRCAVVAPASG